ncbi:M12 family metallopeptidase [Deinococcus multiflagellatus]|uniref:M12 family metallopeptidase n=1 Tax=Deinococcus multiflagellatus TaxID=1656887 RepID=A0ABW1ZS60_9DEIO|nr:M12 family metallopeptidase [Deinococcus multiflagellatus]MBZ9715930.1 hypothetical protein [Deinococcus multiflagellatus]
MMKRFPSLVVLSLALSACSQLNPQTPAAPSAHNPMLGHEQMAAALPVISAREATTLSSQALSQVKVRHSYTFANGEQIHYTSVGNLAVDNDIVLGDLAEVQKNIAQYEEFLKAKANPGQLSEQGMILFRCPSMTWWGGCLTSWEGARWDQDANGNTPVYYEPLSATMGASGQAVVTEAMRRIQAKVPRIYFVPSTTAPNRIRFTETANNGCWSRLGRAGGVQQLNLQPPDLRTGTCQVVGIAQHEILHALGVAHEHQRPDRDTYINVNWNALNQTGRDNFFAYWARDVDQNQITSFDYGSIMLYDPNDWGGAMSTAPGTVLYTTKQPVPAGTVLGQRNDLSDLDVQALKMRYGY